MAIKIIGIGPGAIDYILPKANKEMENSDIILGYKRAIQSISHITVPKKTINSFKELLDNINIYKNKTIAIVASGDPCFYGILEYIKNNIDREISVVPGISSFQYLMSKLQKSWHGAYVGSLHGREADFQAITKNYCVSVWLTDLTHNVEYICDQLLLNKKTSYKIYVGENLSYPDERITEGSPDKLKAQPWSDLCVVVVEQNSDL